MHLGSLLNISVVLFQLLSLSVSHVIFTDQDLDRLNLFREAASTFSASIFLITPDPFWAQDTTVAIRRQDEICLRRDESDGIDTFEGGNYREFRSKRVLFPSSHSPSPSSPEINVGIDTSRLGSRLASSPPQCVPRQMSLSIRRCIVSRCAVRLFSSPHARFQRGFFCRYLAICDRAHLYFSRFLSNKKRVYVEVRRVSRVK